MGSMTVLASGLLTTVQDRGRWGWQAWGVPVAGPMDPWAFRLANWLVGNDEGAAGLEITLRGPTLRFDHPTLVAMAGAMVEVRVDARAIEADGPFTVPAGAVLEIGRVLRGARAYMAAAGGIETDVVFGSRATHLPSRLGGVEGRALRAADTLPIGAPRGRERRPRADLVRTLPRGGARLRVLPGPQDDAFTAEALETLVAGRYAVAADSNRMGYRLQGARLTHRRSADILSDATTFGSIQVPSDGLPILLMADRQTSGGYPKIGTVISADLGLAGQLVPGDWVEFAWCEPADALRALIEQERVFL